MSQRQRHNASRFATFAGHFMPDMTKLIDLSPFSANGPNGRMPAPNGNGSAGQAETNYESSPDLNQITRRQLEEDINAYRYDLDFCTMQSQIPDLSPPETRTVQLRVLDLGHQIRHCQHRIELIDAQALKSASKSQGRPVFQFDGAPTRPAVGIKRPRVSHIKPSGSDDEDPFEVDINDGSSVQRLGFWKCHLCTASKYLAAGTNRVPSAPCKWPLRDVSKMLNHYLDMHTEHDAEERCMELGAALAQNRGPFEYWLTRTHQQNLGDGSIIDQCIEALQAGCLPEALRNLNRAAAAFPNSSSGSKKDEV